MSSILKLFRVRFSEPAAPQPKPGARGEHVRLSNPWHSVSVVPGTTCCSAVNDLSGRRYLSSETPPALPLKQCQLIACTCRYRHHDDRRARAPASMRPGAGDAPRRRVEDSPGH